MSKRENLLLLEDIVDACEKIQRYVINLSFDEFITDDKTIDAVIRNFEIMGEAANRLSDDIFLNYRNVEWRQIVGLRNRLTHGYFGVDYQILWKIIDENLLTFKQQIQIIINEIK